MSTIRTSTRLGRFGTLGVAAALSLVATLALSGTASAQAVQSKIAFERQGTIWIMNADGTGQTQLTTYVSGIEPDLSRDGRKIVFTCAGEFTDICAIDAAGGAVQVLTATGDNRNPVFSPDGKKIAFMSRRDSTASVYVMNADGTNLARVETGDAAGNDEEYPAWSPDGQRIAFVRNYSEIYTAKADGSDLQLVTAAGGFKANLAYSPDGSQIAFDDVNDVYVVSAAGGGSPVRLTTTGTQSYDPAWSPDGLRIAFHRTNVIRDEEGSHVETERAIYVMQANGLGLASLNCPNAYSPSWANVSEDPGPEPTPDPTPLERVGNLIDLVKGFNLHHGTANSLLVKLNHARRALEAGDTAAACDHLASFINQVHAQSGKKLTSSQAAQLAGEAALIRSAIGCQ